MKGNKRTISVEEAAEVLGVSRPTAYEAVKRGQIPCLRICGCMRVPVEALERQLRHPGCQEEWGRQPDAKHGSDGDE